MKHNEEESIPRSTLGNTWLKYHSKPITNNYAYRKKRYIVLQV